MANSSKCILEIDLSAIVYNYDFLQKICGDALIGPVVKANGYGLGAAQIAKVLEKKGCRHFFAATIDEGIELRKVLGAKANIYVLYGVFSDDVRAMEEYRLIPVINHLGQLELWQKLSKTLRKELPFSLHCDTGMNRLGMSKAEFEKLVTNSDLYQNLNLGLVISHLSSSEDISHEANEVQLELFKQLTNNFLGSKKSFANSSGVFLGKDYHFDLVRPGAAIYGLNPTPYAASNPMHNTVKLTAPIIQISKVAIGEGVGYNQTFIAKDDSIIATIPIGYGDGYSRAFSNNGIVYIDNMPAPIVGRISMDLVTIDVSEFNENEIYLGKRVEVLGPNCTPDKIAKLSGTIGYEVLTNLGNRFERIYT